MALVSLGSCLFTINSAYAFLDGPMEWDASRISAAIPSGVGFLGAGLIFKQAEKDELSGDVTHGEWLCWSIFEITNPIYYGLFLTVYHQSYTDSRRRLVSGYRLPSV